jgi:hypothetical protein
MAGNHRLTTATNADSRAPAAARTVRVQVTPAHAGGFHFEHHFTRTRCWVWELSQFQAAVAEKHYATHIFPLL